MTPGTAGLGPHERLLGGVVGEHLADVAGDRLADPGDRGPEVGAVSGGILASVGLEVLGLGPQNVPTLGRTLYYSFQYTAMLRGMWWWWCPPIATLAIIFTGLFLMSISLDKYANPRLKGARGG